LLEEKKENLKRLRSLHLPITLEHIDEHKRKYLEHKEKKDQELY
jgi:hypothetical protein